MGDAKPIREGKPAGSRGGGLRGGEAGRGGRESLGDLLAWEATTVDLMGQPDRHG